MNARVQRWGTWILSILFFVGIAVTWYASAPVLMILTMATLMSEPMVVWLLAAVAVLLVLPLCLAVGGLHLWRKTRFPWLAIVPALVAVTVISTFITYGRLFFLGQH